MLSSPDISSLTAVVEHDVITGGDIDFMAEDNFLAKGDCSLSAAKDVDVCSFKKEAVFKSSTVSLKFLMMLCKSKNSNNQRLVLNDFIWANGVIVSLLNTLKSVISWLRCTRHEDNL